MKLAVSTFIVRVYYNEQENSHRLSGIVDKAGREEKEEFHMLNELWDI